VDSALNAGYEFFLLNHSRENKNLDLLADFKYPQRFGFPVLLVLDSDGHLLHTQNTVFLEKEKSYDEKTVLNFLKHWSPAALDPNNYN